MNALRPPIALLTCISFMSSTFTPLVVFAQERRASTGAGTTAAPMELAPSTQGAQSVGSTPRSPSGPSQGNSPPASPSEPGPSGVSRHAPSGSAASAAAAAPSVSGSEPAKRAQSESQVAANALDVHSQSIEDVSPLAGSGGGDKAGASSQAISVPQGSGKIQGMGESFSTQLSTGVATFTVPIKLLHARGGAQPSLALAYSSGGGHGIVGVGWDIGVPSVSRQTDRGLPSYNDQSTWQPQQDRFIFNGGQELVPICTVGSGGAGDAGTSGPSCAGALPNEVMPAWSNGWQYFRPRIEGAYQRFFWSPDHRTWRVQAKTGESMELGVPLDASGATGALETDPNDASRIFRWNLARQYDNQGSVPPAGAAAPAPVNLVVYAYANDGGMDYLTDIYDTPPAASATTAPLSTYAHHVHLHYEQRPDPTFSFRRGWRVDQRQRLVGIDVSAVPTLASSPTRHQVARYHLTYDANYHVSLLTQIQVEGRCVTSDQGESSAPGEDATTGLLPAATGCGTLPPMKLGYRHVDPHKVDGSSQTPDLPGYEGFDDRLTYMSSSPPNSIDDNLTDLFDINSDGLPDVVTTAPGQDSKFPLYLNGSGGAPNAFGALRLGVQGVLGATSTQINLVNDNLAAGDFDGDGTIDWMHQPAVKSFAIYTPQLLPGGWTMVGRAIPQSANQDPHLDLGEDTPDINVFDVNGDGLIDVVRATGTEMQTFLSLGRFPGGDGNFGSATWAGPTSANLSLAAVTSCVPMASAGVPVQFSDSSVRLGDMNGDGLQDIIYVQPGSVKYWPGRGDGSWGTGQTGDCASGFASDTFIPMASAPQYSDPSGSGLRVDDVNGDGLDDLVQVRFDGIDVWLNVDGTGWTQRHTIQGAPPGSGPNWASKVRLVDINGSGTRDIVWGEGGNYRYIDVTGGQQPWVLTRVDNGLGKTTDIAYSTSTAQMLAAEAAGRPWASKAPMPIHVVASVTDRDNLPAAGGTGGVYVTQYTYRDAVYDGRQREFRGFRTTTARRTGDANSPSSNATSEFLLGDCTDDEPPPAGLPSRCIPAGRWADNPREALKGLPVVTETYDDNGVYQSTAHHQYTLRLLYTGLDGREVRAAFDSQSDTWAYDTASFVAASPAAPLELADVTLDGVQGPDPSSPMPLVERATAGTAHTRTRTIVDVFGNVTHQIDDGCVDGCPTLPNAPGVTRDDTIDKVSAPELLACDLTGSGWLWRASVTYVVGGTAVPGGVGSDTTTRRYKKTDYDANCHGNAVDVVAQLQGTAALDRFFSDGSDGGVAPPPATASQNGSIAVSSTSYDGFGNVVSQAGADGRCRSVTYTSDYLDMPSSETVYVGTATASAADGGVISGGACAANGAARGWNPLTAVATFDRGLESPTQVTDIHREQTRASYDELGRFISLTKPSPTAVSLASPIPSILIDYDLATPDRPYSIIHTKTQVGADDTVATYRETFAYVDGLGRTTVAIDQADPSAGDAAGWIAGGIKTYDAKGAAERAYLPAFYAGDPRQYPVATAPSSAYSRQLYDAFGRPLQAFALDESATLKNAYHALSIDKWDAEDLAPGPHQGTFASATTDGHGRTVVVTERIHNGGTIEKRDTVTQYLSTGEPQVITRLREADGSSVVRWMAYDTLGRMVLNAEPDTTKNFTPTAGAFAAPLQAPPSTMKAWRYAYDDAGDLVGTSDARGCGSNFAYDLGGRMLYEDYSPCLASQPPYSAPDSAGNGTEVLYTYDGYDSDVGTLNCGGSGGDAGAPTGESCFPIDATLLNGRLVMVSDRGAKTVTRYDGRGRITGVARKLAAPITVDTGGHMGAPSTVLANRYAPHWYVKTGSFDGADRAVTTTTGVDRDLPLLLDGQGTSFVSTQYSLRNVVASVSTGYGAMGSNATTPLVSSIHRDADGPITQVQYGDAAGTTSAFGYDARRRVQSVQTYRGAPAIWSAPPSSYQPAPTPGGATTFQLLLEDVDYRYDAVDNPVEIHDWRSPDEWPAGAKPVSRKIAYDDLYRAVSVDYEYPSGTDPWTDPFDAEDRGVDSDPRRAIPSPHVSFGNRVLRQTFAYDWLGNTSATDDDAHGFYDRSLGAVANGTATQGPYRLESAAGGASGPGGSLNAAYDDAGNLTGLSVTRLGACLPSGSACSQRYAYDWDEIGRLVQARRWDTATPGAATSALPTATPSAQLVYAYDASDERTLKTAVDASDNKLYSAYIFDSLELRRTTWSADYARSASTEVGYLFAHGVRLARLHYVPTGSGTTTPTESGAQLHVLLELPDHLGSTSIVIDRDTSELVERGTYMATGQADSDYRPQRWDSFREDHRFTGKEEDVEVGLAYFGKRFLSPYLGRWMSADPLEVHAPGSADANVYAYVHGHLFALTDPTGLADDPPKQQGWFQQAANYVSEKASGAASAVGNIAKNANEKVQQFAIAHEGAVEGTAKALDAGVRGLEAVEQARIPVVTQVLTAFTGAVRATEAATGQRLGDGSKMSTAERVIQGGGAVLDLAGAFTEAGKLSAKPPGAPGALGMAEKTEKEAAQAGEGAARLRRFDGRKPEYAVNDAHVPGRGLRSSNNKTPLPADAEAVYKRAVPDNPDSPRAWFGKNADGQVYRYSIGGGNTAHFSGIRGVGSGVRNFTPYAAERLGVPYP